MLPIGQTLEITKIRGCTVGSILMSNDNMGKIMKTGEAKAIFSPAAGGFHWDCRKKFCSSPLYTGVPR